MNQHEGETNASRESFGELLSQLANTSAALIRDQIELAKEEMRENLARIRSGLVTVAVSAVIGLLALFTLCAAAVIGLGILIGGGMAALVIGLGLAVVAAVIAASGIRRLKRARLKPKETVRSLKENKEWLKEMT
jgi:Putative Actinobacterial Holin-X, holin superfamily III